MTISLETLAEQGALSALDVAFARTMARLADESRPAVLLAVALASRAVGLGHVCLDLARLVAVGSVVDDSGAPVGLEMPPGALEWAGLLRSSQLVAPALADAPPRPLVIDDGNRLYLRRYWLHQETLAEAILARVAAAAPSAPMELL